MTHGRKTEVFKEIFESCYLLQINKAQDYASDSDALSNFKSQDAEALGLTPFQKWGVYFGKQAMSIMNAIGKNPEMPSTTSEPIEERINDAIIYLVLLKCLLEDTGISDRPEEDKVHMEKPSISLNITKNGQSFIFSFVEDPGFLKDQPFAEFFVNNENDPYVKYKCKSVQTVANNTYECIFLEKFRWFSEWKSEPLKMEDLELEGAWWINH